MAEMDSKDQSRRIPSLLESSKKSERAEGFKLYSKFLDQPDVPDGIIKKLASLLVSLVPNYQDRASQHLLLCAIRESTEKLGMSFKSIIELYHDRSVNCYSNMSSSPSNGRYLLFPLNFGSCILQSFKKCDIKLNTPELLMLLEAMSIYFTPAINPKIPKLEKRLLVALEPILEDDGLVSDFLNSISDPELVTVYQLVLGAWIFGQRSLRNQDVELTPAKKVLTQAYVKQTLQCKKKPSIDILTKCQPLLKNITDQEFSSVVLPAVQKALLRNPEVILESVAYLISSLDLDLSKYVDDFSKVLQNPLHANEDMTRQNAVLVCEKLSLRCKDPAAVKTFIKMLFSVLLGSDGKLTDNAHKISLLEAIEKSFCHGVEKSQRLLISEDVCDRIIKFLESETHEGSLLRAVSVLGKWGADFENQLPESVIAFISKGVNSKSSSMNTRASYSRYLCENVNKNTVAQFLPAIPHIIKYIDKALLQPSQVQCLGEALSWCTLLTKLSVESQNVEANIEPVWSSGLDLKKKYFTSDRFLNQSTPEVLIQLISLCEILLGSYPGRLGTDDETLHQALAWGLASSDSTVKGAAQNTVRRLCALQGNVSLTFALTERLYNVLGMIKEESSGEMSLCAVGVIQGLFVLLTTKDMSVDEKESLALLSVKIIYHPAVVAENRIIWPVVEKSLGVKPTEIFEKHCDKLIQFINEEMEPTVISKEYLKGLLNLGGSVLYSKIVPLVMESLEAPDLLKLSEEDIAIFNTPPDNIYHQNVIDDAFENELNLKNVKRSTKAYSHQEEMTLLQDRRKALEQKRKAGKLDLTPKQKEVVKNQLEKESLVRNRVLALENQVTKGLFLLEAAVKSNIDELCPFIKTLVPLLIKYLPSKLVGDRLASIFYDLRTCVFTEEDIFGKLVAWTTISAFNSKINIPLDWRGRNAQEAAIKVIKELESSTAEMSKLDEYYLNAAGLVYCYPLLDWVMTKCPKPDDISKKNQATVWGLSVIRSHMSMRGSSEDCPYHPKFMPRLELLNLLVTIISTKEGRIQQTACAILQDVCASATGDQGCDRVSQSEISVLLAALTAPAQSVRDASLRGLNVLIDALANLSLEPHVFEMMTHRLWVAKHDEDDSIRQLANDLWEAADMEVNKNLLDQTLGDVSHTTAAVRLSASLALQTLAESGAYSLNDIVDQLIEIYKQGLTMTPVKHDQYARVIAEAIDHWEGRSGVALALNKLAPLFDEENVIALAKFFVPDSLGDRDETVRKDMLAAGMAVINLHGKKTVAKLLPVFEKFLNNAPKNAQFDAVRQSVVVLMGSLAKHLEPTDPKIKPIVTKLVEALATPSQPVQEAVASCLYPLVPCIKADAQKMVKKLMNTLLESNNYGQRKGAAYGLAAVVKGLGILSLKQLDIMNQLTTSIQNKKVHRYREGALIAIEQLCNILGKLFEPYIVYILPHLLTCFGDANVYVRQAADDTAKAVMSKLSSHGVKLVLPSLLAALEEDSWRTKAGSIDLLGNMAFCAPKQLSSCLPSIVPRLIDVTSDSHQKVQEAGAQALKLIGSVIRNPEIQAIVPVLLDALHDPSKNTSSCLQTLLETKFIHFIDAPSLALIMPVVERSYQDRSTEVRKMSAQIIGNMYSLTDQKDLAPYLPNIIPGLKTSLLDPVPKVRTVSARALGAMVRGMGESSFDDLLPWLMQTLTSEASPVDRSGAAQGLAEVVGGLGPEKLHRLMPDIVATAERQDIAPQVKDGYIMMFIFLPTVFEEEFTQYIGQIIPSILKALADENEYVRDTALRAGQRIVNTYAETAVTLLLPELENGLFHNNWRIRYSSVQLLGDLLYRVSGVSGKMTTDTAHEDDNFGTEQSQKAIMRVLGPERRNRVLAGLYMGRSDLALMVRQAALHVWKVVVTNTPKTLREILPTLFSLLLGCLASTSYDKRQVAARTLGDLVRKLGERVLPEIIPILESGLESDLADHRQGVCIGLSEIMASTSRDNVLCFTENLVTTVRRALCDPLPQVREAGAHTFDSLHNTVGSRALDDILKPMLLMVQKKDETSDFALDGLKQVMTIKSRVVLPYLIPQLTAPPVNTEALCILASVAGEALTKHLPKILPSLIDAIKDASENDNDHESTVSHCQDVILAVNDGAGVNIIVDELLQHSKSQDFGTVRASAYMLMAFCSSTQTDYTDYVPQLIRGLLNLFTHKDKTVLQTAWSTLAAVTKSLDPSEQRNLVHDVRQSVKFAASDLAEGELMPGFCLPKGIQPILPIFREAILNGEADCKESASNGLTEVIRLTSCDSLKASVIHVTGPLIRVLGDRFDWNVKAAVLDTLALLLEKAGMMLKPFLPQLQTTFVKSVSDPHRGVRLKAGHALSKLIVIHTKPDPLFTELHNLVKVSEDTLYRETTLQALRSVVGPAGNKMSEPVMKTIVSTVKGLLSNSVETIRLCAAGVLGVLFKWMSDENAASISTQYMLDDNNSDANLRHGKSSAMLCALRLAPTRLLEVCSESKVSQSLMALLTSDQSNIVSNGVVGLGFFMLHQLLNKKDVPSAIVYAFAKCVNHSSNEVKQSVCKSCQYIAEQLYAQRSGEPIDPQVAALFIPHLVNATKEKNPIVRSSAEMALIAVLHMKNQNIPSQVIVKALDKGGREALMDAVNKSLRKVTCIALKENEVDPSWLT